MTLSRKEAYLAMVISKFYYFLKYAFSIMYPRNAFMENWHIRAIVYCLERCIGGKMPKLIINLPPRYLKSFITSVVLPAFILGKDPTAKIICVSYSDELAKAIARDFKRFVESVGYQSIFPHVRWTKTAETEYVTNQGGFRLATSITGTLTGRGGDIFIIDDPIKPADALSDKSRHAVNEWFNHTLYSRLDSKQYSVAILVMQRVHVNDPTAYVGARGSFHKISFPAIAVKDESIPISDTEEYFRAEGEALHEEWEGIATLNQIRDQIGLHNFASQYQQAPESPDGALFKRKWLKFINESPNIGPDGLLCVSIDAASSTSETANYSAISLVYSDVTGHYVLFAERGHWDYEMLRDKAWSYVQRYGRDIFFIVEAASNGIALISTLIKAGLNCFHHKPRDDKVRRAIHAVPIIESGRLYILSKEGHNDWVEPFINELVTFPFGLFDDQVDSLVQVLCFAEPRVNPGGGIYFA